LNKTVTIGEASTGNGWQIFVVVVITDDFQFNYFKNGILLLSYQVPKTMRNQT
jgi:hypothetical protein